MLKLAVEMLDSQTHAPASNRAPRKMDFFRLEWKGQIARESDSSRSQRLKSKPEAGIKLEVDTILVRNAMTGNLFIRQSPVNMSKNAPNSGQARPIHYSTSSFAVLYRWSNTDAIDNYSSIDTKLNLY
ncbi:hypothetical protein O181_010122 [Austropuccinia psidii MF-1]|uniref:Uncharacterized protein n=1 Tax=Austropuccinia psidii MF-1 TaxID=1389203 RepID=A0A9Q3BRZ9_9BASI|nr:hypothetical protein [Austropuccinia psidii MF-1]